MKATPRAATPILWFILSLICASCMEFYVAKIWSVGQPPHFSDLYAPWWGTHELFLHGQNPYMPAVAHEIQTVIYGAPHTPAYRGDPFEIAGGFSYPLYAAFFLWPTVHMPFPTVQPLIVCISAAVTLASLGMWLYGLRLRRSPMELLTLVSFAFGSFPVLQGMRLQNLSLIAGAILTLSAFLLAQNHLALAGVMLAASTFKPQFTIVLVPWLALWTVSDWRRRQSLAWSFLASMFVLIAAAEWLLPGWFGNFLHVAIAYTRYTFGRSLLDVWFTPRWGSFAAAGLLLVVFAVCWQYRRHPANSPATLAVISLVLATTLVIVPTLAPHTQILLFPGILCLLRYGGSRFASRRSARLSILSVWLLLAWPWVAASALTIASSILPANLLSRWWEVPLYTSPILPLAVAFALGFLIRNQIWPVQLDPSPQ
jgi:Glycosyltransferase family 87